jgi:hypothetical protein
LIYGAWVDGTGLGWVSLYLLGFLALLAAALHLVNRWNEAKEITVHTRT